MRLLVMPPGAEAKACCRENRETAIFTLEGKSWFGRGPNLKHLDRVEEGDFVYIFVARGG